MYNVKLRHLTLPPKNKLYFLAHVFMIPEKYSSGAPLTCSIWFHLGLLHTILHERLGILRVMTMKVTFRISRCHRVKHLLTTVDNSL